MPSLPQAFVSSMRAILGSQADAFFAALNDDYAAALRLNPLRPDAAQASHAFLGDAVPWWPQGYYIKPGARPGLHPLQAAGAYYIQEASAMMPVTVLAPQPGQVVLDLCAAPGGKTGQIAGALGGKGALVANEPDRDRAKLLSATVERLGVPNAMVTCEYPDRLAARFPCTFDAILVDAPCSGEGMFRRETDSRLMWLENSPSGCVARQLKILESAAAMLKPGGRMVYSTCTFNNVENEGVVATFLAQHSEFRPVDYSLPGLGASQNGCMRVWPHLARGDGQFACLMVKDGTPAPTARAKQPRPDKKLTNALQMLTDIAPGWANLAESPCVTAQGDDLWLAPAMLPTGDGLRVLRRGVKLCRVGRGYIEPDHALAMALTPGMAAQHMPVNEGDARRLLTGETLPTDMRGWTLLTTSGMPLGWGKASVGIMKNHIPKGLRIH